MMNLKFGLIDGESFFLSCEAFFALNNGEEYLVTHYLFKKRDQ